MNGRPVAEPPVRIGIDLGGTKIHGVLLGPGGAVVGERRIATPRHAYDATLSAVAALARELDPAGQARVGIGTPGARVPTTGLMHNCNSTWLNGRPLLADLRRLLGDRVRIANDADCFALSEAHGGAASGTRCAFGVILGTGVGGGVVVDGRLLAGPNGVAGEWGHVPLPRFPASPDDRVESRLESRLCYCGRLNCIETFLSGPGLARTMSELWQMELTPEEIYRTAALDAAPLEPGGAEMAPRARPHGRREQARATLSLWCRMLARGLAQIINVLDPGVIVLGGGLSNMMGVYRPVTTLLKEDVFGGACTTPVVPPAFGDASGVRGAAWLWGGPRDEPGPRPMGDDNEDF